MTRGTPDELPAEFDPDLYVAHPAHVDLRGLDADQTRHHYDLYGRAEGRLCSAIDGRESFLNLMPCDGTPLSIEPAVPLSVDLGSRAVRRLADRTTAELREMAERAGVDPAAYPRSISSGGARPIWD
jgi:hypothetical protein